MYYSKYTKILGIMNISIILDIDEPITLAKKNQSDSIFIPSVLLFTCLKLMILRRYF